MRIAVLLVLLAGRAVAQPAPEIGAVEVATEVVYYDVEGDTVDDIAASLQARTPSRDTPRFYGLTEWKVNAEYRWVGSPTGCAVEDVVVRLLIQTHMPRWRAGPRAEADARRGWGRFSRSLERHEARHRALIEETGEALRWGLVSLREPTCGTMKAAADRTIEEQIGAGTARNDAYDEATKHGRTEGAVWPVDSR